MDEEAEHKGGGGNTGGGSVRGSFAGDGSRGGTCGHGESGVSDRRVSKGQKPHRRRRVSAV